MLCDLFFYQNFHEPRPWCYLRLAFNDSCIRISIFPQSSLSSRKKAKYYFGGLILYVIMEVSFWFGSFESLIGKCYCGKDDIRQ